VAVFTIHRTVVIGYESYRMPKVLQLFGKYSGSIIVEGKAWFGKRGDNNIFESS
jgi:hypothetical protein